MNDWFWIIQIGCNYGVTYSQFAQVWSKFTINGIYNHHFDVIDAKNASSNSLYHIANFFWKPTHSLVLSQVDHIF